MPRPLVVTVDVAALQHNLDVARAHAPGARTWAVVKANAYGHGLARAVRGFARADGLGLVEPEGVHALRQSGWNKRILLLEGCFDTDDLMQMVQHEVDIVVHSLEQLIMLEQTHLSRPVDVHMKINTGMNRLGFAPSACRDVYARLQAIPAVRSISFITHFANADEEHHSILPVSSQRACFDEVLAGLSGERCLANSAADLLHADSAGDWVRPGIMLYGATPSAAPAASFDLRPAMTLHSEIIGVQHINRGDAIGYGSTFVADAPMTIGVVACGYADGYPRHAPNGTPVLVDGARTRMVGRVSMDMITVDLTPVAQAGVGSKVVLWGDGLPIDEVAQAAGTVGYELMCAVTPRVRVVEIG